MVYFVAGLFLLSGFTTLGMGDAGEKQGNLSVSFLEPTVVEKELFVELKSEGTNSWIFDAGSPMVPIRIETLTLPFWFNDRQYRMPSSRYSNQGVIKENYACSTTSTIEW